MAIINHCLIRDCLFEPTWHSGVFGFVCDYHLHYLGADTRQSPFKSMRRIEVGRLSSREPNMNPRVEVERAEEVYVPTDRRFEIREEPIPAGKAWGDIPAVNKQRELFFADICGILDRKAHAKGYAPAGGDGPDLAAFVEAHAPGHALGEIIYKVVRYGAKKDSEDLVKIAAWAYLIWAGGRKGEQ